MKNKILVTGADGFIGSHLVEKLVKLGYSVKAFVHYNPNGSCGWLDKTSSDLLKEIEIFSGDIRDPNGVEKSLENCNIVFNLAALIGIPYSYHSPNTYLDTNVNGLLNILNNAKKNKISKIIHTSTSEVYGTAKKVPIPENHPLNAQSPYAATKIAADQLAMSFYKSFDTPVGIIRPFNTYGPRQSMRAVIPSIIVQILKNKKSIKLGELKPTRDFNFIDDTVAGFVSQLKSNNGIGEIINISSNFEISIGDTVNLISQLMKKEISVKKDKIRLRPKKSEVNRLIGDNRKAKKLLKWKPKYSNINGFKKGLEQTIDWFTNNLSDYKNDYLI